MMRSVNPQVVGSSPTGGAKETSLASLFFISVVISDIMAIQAGLRIVLFIQDNGSHSVCFIITYLISCLLKTDSTPRSVVKMHSIQRKKL